MILLICHKCTGSNLYVEDQQRHLIKYRCNDCGDISCTHQLGKHAKRMLEIGQVQDELEKLDILGDRNNYFNYYKDQNEGAIFSVVFNNDENAMDLWAYQHDNDPWRYCLDNPNWQQELLNKVKGLINNE